MFWMAEWFCGLKFSHSFTCHWLKNGALFVLCHFVLVLGGLSVQYVAAKPDYCKVCGSTYKQNLQRLNTAKKKKVCNM